MLALPAVELQTIDRRVKPGEGNQASLRKSKKNDESTYAESVRKMNKIGHAQYNNNISMFENKNRPIEFYKNIPVKPIYH